MYDLTFINCAFPPQWCIYEGKWSIDDNSIQSGTHFINYYTQINVFKHLLLLIMTTEHMNIMSDQ